MSRNEYLGAVNEIMYRCEVLGEALLDCYVSLERDTERRYEWGTLLQIEPETKARLRPFLTRLGLRSRRMMFAIGLPLSPRALLRSRGTNIWKKPSGHEIHLEKFREIEAAARIASAKLHIRWCCTRPRYTGSRNGARRRHCNSLNDVIAQHRSPTNR